MPPSPDFYLPGTQLGGKYFIERLLGHGGMGAVYLAENRDIGRKVAIKVLLPQFAFDAELLARFRNEARAASAVLHPGIVEMLDLGEGPSGEPFLVMELLEGESLGTRLRRTRLLEMETVVWIGLQLLEAIGAAHEKGIVHRDLKPDNVFLIVSPRAAVKVLDFGISKFHQEHDKSMTRTSTILGTPAYMSPEQARSARAAGPPADLYAIGAILYESLTGAPPFDGQSYNEIVAKVLTEPHRPLREVRRDLPASLSNLVDALLAKAPEDRPANAAEVSARLRAAFAVVTPDLRGTLGEPAAEDLVGATMRHSRSAAAARRSRRLLVAFGLGVLAIALGGAGLLWRASPALTAADVGMVADAAPAPEAGRDAASEVPAPPDASAEIGLRPDASARPRPARPDAPKLPPPPRPKPGLDAGHAGAPDAGKGRLEGDKNNPFLTH